MLVVDECFDADCVAAVALVGGDGCGDTASNAPKFDGEWAIAVGCAFCGQGGKLGYGWAGGMDHRSARRLERLWWTGVYRLLC